MRKWSGPRLSGKLYIPLLAEQLVICGGFCYNSVMQNGTSCHQAIFETLRREILLGKFSASGKFLSEQQICRRFSVARTTVRLALTKLKDGGMLETRRGSGTYLTSMALNATGRLGMIVPGIASGEIFPPICAEIVRIAHEEGYAILFGDASSSDSEYRAQQAITLAHHYIEQHVSGVFLEPIELVPDASHVTNRIIRLLANNNIPVVLLDRDIVSPPERSPYDLVGLDNVQIGIRLARHLIEKGAHRICCYTRPGSAPTVWLRFLGARGAILDARLTRSAFSVCVAEPDDFGSVKRLMSSRTPPDAFLCGNDKSAIAILEHLRRMRLKVPRDVMVTGIDDVASAVASRPQLTTIRQPCVELGQMAFHTLVQRLRTPGLPPRQILLDAPLVVRGSTSRK